MERMSITTLSILLALAAGGCSGAYHLAVPDQVADAGGETTTVVRVERQEFWLIWTAVEEAAVRFQIDDGQERAAYSDKMGYAGTTVPVPETPGRYTMDVAYLDRDGDDVATTTPVYVWDPARPVLAVDLDALPGPWSGQSSWAVRALTDAAGRYNICYMTRRELNEHQQAHEQLVRAGYPDGPVLLWQRQRWHLVEGWKGIPRVVVESRMVSELPELGKRFNRLAVGLATGPLAAEAYRQAGMDVAVIGAADVEGQATRYENWTDLARRGLP